MARLESVNPAPPPAEARPSRGEVSCCEMELDHVGSTRGNRWFDVHSGQRAVPDWLFGRLTFFHAAPRIAPLITNTVSCLCPPFSPPLSVSLPSSFSPLPLRPPLAQPPLRRAPVPLPPPIASPPISSDLSIALLRFNHLSPPPRVLKEVSEVCHVASTLFRDKWDEFFKRFFEKDSSG